MLLEVDSFKTVLHMEEDMSSSQERMRPQSSWANSSSSDATQENLFLTVLFFFFWQALIIAFLLKFHFLRRDVH